MTLFQSWNELARIVITAFLVYGALILLTRILGKRSTSKMNNFDWVVTVALGSIAGSVILLKDVVLLEGLTAIVALLLLQYTFTFVSVRSASFSHAIHARPTLLFYRGQFLEDAMRRERVVRSEILSVVREQGHAQLGDIVAVVLEADAELSVIADGRPLDATVFRNVEGFPNETGRG